MKTRNQVKIEAIASSCPPKAWHLDLELQKENVVDDLRSLSFIPTIDRLSSTSTQSKGVRMGRSKAEPVLNLETKHEAIKEIAEEKKDSKEKLKVHCKRRLASKVENDAVDCFYKFCKDFWKERNIRT